jgi:hypothetical protein
MLAGPENAQRRKRGGDQEDETRYTCVEGITRFLVTLYHNNDSGFFLSRVGYCYMFSHKRH